MKTGKGDYWSVMKLTTGFRSHSTSGVPVLYVPEIPIDPKSNGPLKKKGDPGRIFGPKPKGRRTRIVATLDRDISEASLVAMITSGMDVARLNTAHGTADEWRACIARIRSASAKANRPVKVQIDLAGPKIRLGHFANPKGLEYNDIVLTAGQKIKLTTAPQLGTPSLLPVDYPRLTNDVKVGHRVLLNDGKVQLRVDDVSPPEVSATVVVGGKVWDRKGINLPDSNVSVPAITDKDREMLEQLASDIDVVALSFVRSSFDIFDGRSTLGKLGCHDLPIIAKIESPEAVRNLEEIAVAADGLMVARGDLGVEVGYANVPAIERRINRIGNALDKPTMVATEVLMSMTKDPSRPSRGEVEGMFGAIHDHGADLIMLGKETSFVDSPEKTIDAAVKVIKASEKKAPTRSTTLSMSAYLNAMKIR